jgi:hypothetical protein
MQTTEWRKIFANLIYDKGLIFTLPKELLQLSKTRRKLTQKTHMKDLTRHFSKNIYKCPISPCREVHHH